MVGHFVKSVFYLNKRPNLFEPHMLYRLFGSTKHSGSFRSFGSFGSFGSYEQFEQYEIEEIVNSDTKSGICDDILRALPDSFSMARPDSFSMARPDSFSMTLTDSFNIATNIDAYTSQVRTLPFYAAFDSVKAVGFAAVAPHNQYTAEICVMGVREEFQRRGIGRMLVSCCLDFCKENKMEFLIVKTLEKTTDFYSAIGFRPIETIPSLGDKNAPRLLMAKSLSR